MSTENVWSGSNGNLSTVPFVFNNQTHYQTDAFGNELSVNPLPEFGFNSERMDSETGLQYLGARYYDPSIGRFTQEDPIRWGTNWYSYCGSDPVNNIDPSGLKEVRFQDYVQSLGGRVNWSERCYCPEHQGEIYYAFVDFNDQCEGETFYNKPAREVDNRVSVRDGVWYIDDSHINDLYYQTFGFYPPSNSPEYNISMGKPSVPWYNWAIGGASIVGGTVLLFVPGGQIFGVGLLVSGGSSMTSNILSASGVNSKTVSQVSSGLNIAGGTVLLFTPFAPVGASMIGSGVGSFGGGYFNEKVLGGSYEFGSMIGGIGGGIAGGQIYNGLHFSNIAKQGILIGKDGAFQSEATARGLAYYNGMPGYNAISKISPAAAQQLGWANNYEYVNSVMKYGGTIYDLGGPLTGSYGKEVLLVNGYQYLVKLY